MTVVSVWIRAAGLVVQLHIALFGYRHIPLLPLHRDVSDTEAFIAVSKAGVILTEEVQKLPDGYIFGSVGWYIGVVEIGKLSLAVHLLPQQKILFVVHEPALPDFLAVLLHGHHGFQLLQGAVRHIAQWNSKFQTSGLAKLPCQSGADQLCGIQRRAGCVDADPVFPAVHIVLRAGVYLVAHRLAPKYLMVMLLAAVAVNVRVTFSPSGISSPSRYCHSVVLARLPL